MGARLTVDKFNEYAKELITLIVADAAVDAGLKTLLGEISAAPQGNQAEIEAVR